MSMTDPVTIGKGALTALKGAIETVKKLQKLSQDAAINQTAIDLQGIILSLQSEIFDMQTKYGELLQIKNDLKQQLSSSSQWSDTAIKYELTNAGRDNYLYALKVDYHSTEPDHYICPNCYEDKIKSILHCIRDDNYETKYGCKRCKSEWTTKKSNPPVIRTRQRY